ncbi:uncharacterized protein LOC125812816 [Solanum verrucosum]|uniref:uncharacterized protein LOC125812816 n=1 Tax=Solanum verrucosum TaxID=315347 RepID=UPI0020CFF9E7|nr:uncharacterized protein LOC125812816 [Solanum verrucosum]
MKNPKITPYVQYIQKLCKRFCKIGFKHTPRTHNELEDAIATIASMIKHLDTSYIDPLNIEVKKQLVHSSHVEAKLDGFPWYFDIKKYLEIGTYPENATFNQKKSIRRMSNNLFTSGEILYRRTPDLGFLICVDVSEAAKLLEHIHAGVCGTHMNGLTLAKKILRAGYFWMTMKHYYCKFMQKSWVMDVIGPIEPATSNGHRFILVAIDYFTKWVEVASYKSVTKNVVADFITYRNSTAYRPRMNGVVEAANKNIKKILRKMVDNNIGWHEMLPYVLLGYRITVRTSIGATPYLLLYGTEAVIPTEVEIPSLRIIQEAELNDVEWVRKRIDQSTLID